MPLSVVKLHHAILEHAALESTRNVSFDEGTIAGITLVIAGLQKIITLPGRLWTPWSDPFVFL